MIYITSILKKLGVRFLERESKGENIRHSIFIPLWECATVAKE
jgi:hypothetical protein